MIVLTKHKVTGKLAHVSEAELAHNANLEPATDADVEAIRKAREIKVYGHELGLKPAPRTPDMTWSKAELIALAQHRKIEVDDSITKAELVEALTEGSK